ncbi:MAG: LytR C-terminal domain-containing protein, partial [Acidobacteriota bacterium]|nr:LytR C-terminal domain-containing protein [Acidobacteriota bacterium]
SPSASASPRGAVAAPPRVQIGAERRSADSAPATSAGGGGIRRIGGHPQAPVSLPPFDDEPAPRRRFAGRLLPLLIGVVAIAVIVAGLIVVINAGGGSTTGNVNHNGNPGQTGQNLHNRHSTPPPFHAATVTVAVLNGTAQSGLAGDVGKKLGHDGYKQGNITNAAAQTQTHTYVYYVAHGRATTANRIAAQHVARALALSRFWVRKAGHTALQSCSISAAGTSLGSCSANVIVSVGQNRVNLASGG